MGKNNQWNYTNDELIQMLKDVVEKEGEISGHNFTKYGLPTIDTYCKRLKLIDKSKSNLFKYAGIAIKEPKVMISKSIRQTENKILSEMPMKLGWGKSNNKLIIDWEKSIGMDVSILYENDKYIVTIINYDKITKKVGLKYLDNNIFPMSVDSFKQGYYGTLLGKYSIDYKYTIGDIIKDDKRELRITKQIKMPHDKYLIRGYEYQCVKCGNIDTINEGNLEHGKGCNACCISSSKITEEVNSVWAEYPQFISLFVNPEDSKTVSISSNRKKVWLKCPDCGTLRYTTMNHIYKRLLDGYFPCQKCSDKKPYPEKFMHEVLTQLNLDFNMEHYFDWSKKVQVDNPNLCGDKRYDFFISNSNILIETNGNQHYEKQTRGRTLEEEVENDRIKKKLALTNRILESNYIVIDCRKSELEFIKQNILNDEKMNKHFDLSKINWLKCHEYAISSLVVTVCDLWKQGYKSTLEIEKITKIPNHRVCKYLKQGKELNMCDYDSTQAMLDGFKRGQRNSVIANSKPLICLDDLEVFFSINDCERRSTELYGLKMWHEPLGKACDNSTIYRGHNFKFIKDLTEEEHIKYDIENKIKQLYDNRKDAI